MNSMKKYTHFGVLIDSHFIKTEQTSILLLFYLGAKNSPVLASLASSAASAHRLASFTIQNGSGKGFPFLAIVFITSQAYLYNAWFNFTCKTKLLYLNKGKNWIKQHSNYPFIGLSAPSFQYLYEKHLFLKSEFLFFVD